jgi:hypothetical protein
MTLLTVGIDDLGTERQLLEGWSYFVIEKELLDEFSIRANELLNGIALDSFHGKNYKRRFKDKYLQFLKLCREYAEKSKISLIGVVLQNEEWKSQYIPFTERIIKNVYGQNGIGNSDLVSSAQMLTSPLFNLQHLTKSLSAEFTLQIIVDSHNVTQGFGMQTIQVSNSIGSTIMTSNQLLNVIYNGYRKLQYPNSPTLIDNGILVISDGDSFLIQAADIMGNFSLSYVKRKLGVESNTIEEKAEIFSEVFGDVFDSKDFKTDFEISETGELNLKFDGQQTLLFGRYGE